MSGGAAEGPPARRLRSGLRRHGLARRPEAIRALVRTRAIRFVEGNRVDFYAGGREAIDAMLAALETARGRVHLETYILRSDATGRRFLDALAARARSGVEVRLLYDALGSRGLADAPLRALRDAGGDVVAFNPLRRGARGFRLRRRDHRKILIVDGRIAFTGGLNLGDEYAGQLPDGGAAWRDAHVRVQGPVVRDLEAVFLESWFRADGPDLAWQSLLETSPPRCGDVRCAVLADGPAYRRRRMRDLLISALEDAEGRVELETPYFAPGRRLLEALADAGHRGVSIRLLIAGRTDHPLLLRAARSILPRLLARGVQIYQYERAMMHGKVAVFDDQWALVGTSNLDRQSLEHSYEVNLIVEGGELPRRLRERFERDCEVSRRVDAASLAARGPFERAYDRLASVLLWLV